VAACIQQFQQRGAGGKSRSERKGLNAALQVRDAALEGVARGIWVRAYS